MSVDRLIHLVAALVFWGMFVAWRGRGRRQQAGAVPGGRERAELALLPFVALGAAVPDWDLWVGGIGFHRSPLFHSVLPVLVLSAVVWKWSRWVVPVGFALGVSSHLMWDVVQYGDVRWIRGGNADRLFLFLNGGVLAVFAVVWRPAAAAKTIR